MKLFKSPTKQTTAPNTNGFTIRSLFKSPTKKAPTKTVLLKVDDLSLSQNVGRSLLESPSSSGTPPVIRKSPERMCVEEYMNAINRHANSEELLRLFTSPKADIYFEDGVKVTAQKSCDGYEQLYKCFPDILWKFESIEEETDCESGTGRIILVEESFCCGTHTGEPFSVFGFPAVPPNGKHFQNDPARFFFRVVDGKIASIKIVSLGIRTGLVGIYENLTAEY